MQAKWLILSFVGMVITGLASLAFVNIPMYRFVLLIVQLLAALSPHRNHISTRVVARDWLTRKKSCCFAFIHVTVY
jgi:hypothetical protein